MPKVRRTQKVKVDLLAAALSELSDTLRTLLNLHFPGSEAVQERLQNISAVAAGCGDMWVDRDDPSNGVETILHEEFEL